MGYGQVAVRLRGLLSSPYDLILLTPGGGCAAMIKGNRERPRRDHRVRFLLSPLGDGWPSPPPRMADPAMAPEIARRVLREPSTLLELHIAERWTAELREISEASGEALPGDFFGELALLFPCCDSQYAESLHGQPFQNPETPDRFFIRF